MNQTRRVAALLVALLLTACPCRADDPPSAGKPWVDFLGGDAARKVMVDDSDGYFGMMSALEIVAKTGKPLDENLTAEQRVAEAKRRHADAVLEFTPEEREALAYYVSKVHPVLREHYPRLAALPWRFVKVAGTHCSGLPHTRADCIVLAEPVLARLAPVPQDPESLTTKRAVSLLLHEQLHVMQRKEPRRFDDLYTRVWKFRRVDGVDGTEKLRDRTIVNPDAPLNEWVYPVAGGRWVWPLMVFRKGTDATNASLMRMQQAAADVEEVPGGRRFRLKGTEGELVPLESLEEYMSAFFPTGYSYHPNEASADLFATLVSYDSFGAKEAVPEDERDKFDTALAPLRKWFRGHLGEAP